MHIINTIKARIPGEVYQSVGVCVGHDSEYLKSELVCNGGSSSCDLHLLLNISIGSEGNHHNKLILFKFTMKIIHSHLRQDRSVLDDVFVGGKENIELATLQERVAVASHVRGSFVGQLDDRRSPLVKLHHPIRNSSSESKSCSL